MKLNKYALVLFLGLGTLTSCNDNLELLNPNQQTSNTGLLYTSPIPRD